MEWARHGAESGQHQLAAHAWVPHAARMVAFDTDGRSGDIAIHFQSPVARWLAPGFWLGLLGVFGLEGATATVAEADGGYLLSVRWTTPR